MRAGDISVSREEDILQRIKSGDRQTRHQFLDEHLDRIFILVERYVNFGVSFGDLLEQGKRSFLKSIEKYNPETGVNFWQFAAFWIKHDIYQSIRLQTRNSN